MSVNNTTYRVLVEKLGAQDPNLFVGNEGEVFYDSNTPSLKLSDGTTVGGLSIGGGTANTGNITFSNERIIGSPTNTYPYGIVQIAPTESSSPYDFIGDGQYLNIYPTTGQDAPHIHISAGTLSTTSAYYNDMEFYYKGDLFLGDDSNYVSVLGNGVIDIYSNTHNGIIRIDNNGFNASPRVELYMNGNDLNVRSAGLDFNQDFGIAKSYSGYVGQGTTDGVIYSTQMYGNQIGSMKILIQCMGDGGGCQLSELLLVKSPNSNTTFISEVSRVSNRATNAAHCTFTSSYNTDYDIMNVIVDTTSSPDSGGWSFMSCATEIRRYID